MDTTHCPFCAPAGIVSLRKLRPPCELINDSDANANPWTFQPNNMTLFKPAW
jgi:hypothetical protein